MRARERDPASALTAFYDLSVSPTGFDSAVFFALADLARQRRNCAGFNIVFVPAAGSGFWQNETYDADYKAWRLHHLLLPLATLFPTCRGFTLCATRDEAATLCRGAGKNIFPEGYTTEAPPAEIYQWAYFAAAITNGERWSGWTPPAAAIEFVDQWFASRAGGRKVVTITLREASYHTEHNSNRQAWAAFARNLDQEKYFPVFVRDTEAVLTPLPEELRDCTVFAEPSFNVALRAALYLKAHLNMMSASGPMYLAWLHPHCRILVFRLLDLADYRSTPTSLAALGFEPGRQPCFLSSHQHIVWSGDDVDSINKAFAKIETPCSPLDATAAETSFDLARRLRHSARLGAARQIYIHLLKTVEDEVSGAAARAGLALIALNGGGARRGLALLRLDSPNLRAVEHAVATKIQQFEASALLDLSDWCIRLDRLDLALSICELVLATWPESAEGQALAGDIDLRLGRTREALSRLSRAIDLRPWSAATRYAHGVALLLQEHEGEAKREFVAAALNDPSHEAARLRLAALAPEYRLPDGFRYQDTVARRAVDATGVVGEIPYPIALPERRHGRKIVWYNGSFHALADTELAVSGDWRRQDLISVAPRYPALFRMQTPGSAASIRGLIAARITALLLYRRYSAHAVASAPTLSALDRQIDGTLDRMSGVMLQTAER